MKQLIAPIAIIVALIAFFVVIDRKDFYSSGDVAVQKEAVTGKKPTMTTVKPVEAKPMETKPVAETKPVETKPVVETKPTTAKPAETKPVAETKPAETKPVAETKPTTVKPVETKPVAETKPVETKPVVEPQPAETKPAEVKATETKVITETKPAVETKPVTETKEDETKPVEKNTADTVAETKSMPAPTAVPVVSAEEAVNLNEFAIFLADIKKTVVEGEIVERSELPDPQKSDYPNCRFTIHFKGNSIKSGEPCPKEIVLIVEGFSNYSILKNNKLKQGYKIRCDIIPFENLPEDYQSTQQADDLNLFALDNYYVLNAEIISKYSDREIMPASGIYFSDGNNNYVSIYERHINPSVSKSMKVAQDKVIKEDLDRINAELQNYDEVRLTELENKFKEIWDKEKSKDTDGYNRIGNCVWRNIDNSFWCLPINYSFVHQKRTLPPDVIKFFVDIKNALESNGVQLIVSLVPHMYSISSRIINKELLDIPDIQTATVVKQLLENGVETIYASNEILENYSKYPFAYFYPSDGHPSDTAQDILSDLLEQRIRRFYPEPPQLSLIKIYLR